MDMDFDYKKMYREAKLENKRLFHEIASMHRHHQEKDAKILTLEEEIRKLVECRQNDKIADTAESTTTKNQFEEDRKMYEKEILELQTALRDKDLTTSSLVRDSNQSASDFKLLEKEYVRMEMSMCRLISENEGLKEQMQCKKIEKSDTTFQRQIKNLQRIINERNLNISFLEWKTKDTEKTFKALRVEFLCLETSMSQTALENESLRSENSTLIWKLEEDKKRYDESIQDLQKVLLDKVDEVSSLQIEIKKSSSDFELLQKEFLLTDSSISQLVAKSESLEGQVKDLIHGKGGVESCGNDKSDNDGWLPGDTDNTSAILIEGYKQEIENLQATLIELRLDHDDLHKLIRLEKERIVAGKDKEIKAVELKLQNARTELVKLQEVNSKRNQHQAVIQAELSNLQDTFDKDKGCLGRFYCPWMKNGRSTKRQIIRNILQYLDDVINS